MRKEYRVKTAVGYTYTVPANSRVDARKQVNDMIKACDGDDYVVSVSEA